MQQIDGQSFPEKWSEMLMDFNKVEKMDQEPTLLVDCIPKWISEFREMPDNASADTIDALLKRGLVLNDYLVGVRWRIHRMHKYEELQYNLWETRTASRYPPDEKGKPLAEAARKRLIPGEPEYESYQTTLINLETMVGWCDDMIKSMHDHMYELNTRLAIRGKTGGFSPL